MQPVPAAGRLGQQVVIVQAVQLAAGGGQVGAVQRGRGVRVDVGAGVHAQAAEQPLLAFGQVLVGQVERGRHRQVLRAHQLQPARRGGQLGGQVRRSPGRVMVQLAGQHPDRQRQVPAQPGDLAGRAVAGAQAGTPGQPGQQRRGLLRRQGIQADRRRVGQRGQVPAAGNQHHAAPGAGQQRGDLLMGGRVVQQQQHLLPGQVVPPPRRPGRQPGRDLLRPDPGGQQQAGQRIDRLDRPLTRRVRMQRQEKLPVRETAGQPVRCVHREGRLADPGHPADRVDPHHAPALRRCGRSPRRPAAPARPRGR